MRNSFGWLGAAAKEFVSELQNEVNDFRAGGSEQGGPASSSAAAATGSSAATAPAPSNAGYASKDAEAEKELQVPASVAGGIKEALVAAAGADDDDVAWDDEDDEGRAQNESKPCKTKSEVSSTPASVTEGRGGTEGNARAEVSVAKAKVEGTQEVGTGVATTSKSELVESGFDELDWGDDDDETAHRDGSLPSKDHPRTVGGKGAPLDTTTASAARLDGVAATKESLNSASPNRGGLDTDNDSASLRQQILLLKQELANVIAERDRVRADHDDLQTRHEELKAAHQALLDRVTPNLADA